MAGIENVNSIAYVDNHSGLVFCKEDLFGMANDDYFSIDADFKRSERSGLQRSFEIHRFHAPNLPTANTSANLCNHFQKFATASCVLPSLRRRKKRFGSEKLMLQEQELGAVISSNGPEAFVELCNTIPGVHESASPLPEC